MNILQIVPNKGWGGGEKYVYQLTRGLREAGHRVGTLIPPCEMLETYFDGEDNRTFPFRTAFDPVALWRLSRFIRKNRPEIVHTHIFKHAMAAALVRKFTGKKFKIVMTRHLSKPGKTGGYYPFLYRQIDRLIFVSEDARQTFRRSGPPVDLSRTSVIHNAIQTSHSGGNARDNAATLKIGFAGGISEQKGIGYIIDLAVNLHQKEIPFELHLAGNGREDYLKEIKSRISSLGVEGRIFWRGFQNDTIGFFEEMDLVIVPSLIKESFSMVTIEAMAAGRPVLFSEQVPAEVITDGVEGIRIDTKNAEATAEMIAGLNTDRTRIGEWGKNARLRFEKEYQYAVFLEKMLGVYRELTEEGHQVE